MFQKKTVFILGAGSSVEFDLPAGDGLAKDIAGRTYFWFDDFNNLSRGDRDLYYTLKDQYPESNQVLSAGRRISAGLPLARSIDEFLDNHGHDKALVSIGKAAIVRSILHAEAHSRIMTLSKGSSASGIEAMTSHVNTWLFQLFSFLQTGVRRSNVEAIFENLTIINFNYDRCVETFLFHALQQAYGLDRGEAAAVTARLDISHPYGQVGALPWQSTSGTKVEFGEQISGHALRAIAGEIKTLTEQSHADDDLAHWKSAISNANQMVFLGFAFHRQNVDLLALQNGSDFPPEVYATTYGASLPDQDVFHRRVFEMLGHTPPESRHLRNAINVEFKSATCTDMIKSYGLQLAS